MFVVYGSTNRLDELQYIFPGMCKSWYDDYPILPCIAGVFELGLVPLGPKPSLALHISPPSPKLKVSNSFNRIWSMPTQFSWPTHHMLSQGMGRTRSWSPAQLHLVLLRQVSTQWESKEHTSWWEWVQSFNILKSKRVQRMKITDSDHYYY